MGLNLSHISGFMYLNLNEIEFKIINRKYYISKRNGKDFNNSEIELHSSRVGYDKIIRCLGFKFDHKKIFDE